MKAVVLTGGEGTRLRAISGGLPKPMMPLLGVPLLERTVALLRENGFDSLCFTLHYEPQIIRGRGQLRGLCKGREIPGHERRQRLRL